MSSSSNPNRSRRSDGSDRGIRQFYTDQYFAESAHQKSTDDDESSDDVFPDNDVLNNPIGYVQGMEQVLEEQEKKIARLEGNKKAMKRRIQELTREVRGKGAAIGRQEQIIQDHEADIKNKDKRLVHLYAALAITSAALIALFGNQYAGDVLKNIKMKLGIADTTAKEVDSGVQFPELENH
jgi:uncharacterized protein (UPF0335 family)